MGQTNIKGDTAELKVAARFLELGYWVSFPVGDDSPYDLIIDNKKELKRIQVKYISEKNGVLQVRFLSSTKESYKNTVDLIAIYCPTFGIYLINPNEFDMNTMLNLRLVPTKSGRKKDIWSADNFKL